MQYFQRGLNLELESLLKIIAALLGSITAGIGLLKLILKNKKQETEAELKQRIDELLRHNEQFHREMGRRVIVGKQTKKIVHEAGALRAGVCIAQNGGSQPNPTCKLTSSICETEHDFAPGEPDIAESWRNQPLSRWYMEELVKIKIQGKHVLYTTDIPDQEFLKEVFIANGIGVCIIFAIASTDGAFYYLPIHFREAKNPTPHQWSIMKFAVNEIRLAYKTYLEQLEAPKPAS